MNISRVLCDLSINPLSKRVDIVIIYFALSRAIHRLDGDITATIFGLVIKSVA